MAIRGTTACAAGLSMLLGHASAQAVDSPEEAGDLVHRYCVDCHNDAEFTGGLTLESRDFEGIAADAETWEKVVVKLNAGAMPPVGEPRPEPDDYHAFADWVEEELDTAAKSRPSPGRPALYRLNRAEYGNAIRDLLALDVDVDSLFLPDNSSYGFDNVADVLGVSATLLESYLAAADRVSAIAVGDPGIAPEEAFYSIDQRYSQDEHIDGLPLGTRGGIEIEHTFPLDAVYEIGTTFLGNTIDGIRGLQFPHQFELAIDGRRVKLVTIGGAADFAALLANSEDSRKAIEERARLRIPLAAGPHTITATFLAKTGAVEVDQLQPQEIFNLDPVYLGGIPSVADVVIRGPFDGRTPQGDTPSRAAIFSCRPDGPADELHCAEDVLTRLARRAFRRPIEEADVNTLLEFYRYGKERKGTFDGGIQMGLRRILASPDFMFRIEREPEDAEPGDVYRISDVELASRLSFFLWSSIPDEELLDLATRNELSDEDVLEEQIARMLADPRARALVDNFAAQWLQLRNLDSVEPDIQVFPSFDDNLRRAFLQETTLFVESVFREDRNIVELLTADYTFMNERLARHYGVDGVYGNDFRRVPVEHDARRGLLGHGSILTVTSYSHRTSPVVRGKWVLENLLAAPPPLPPDDIPALDENDPESLEFESVRERLARHREDAACAACHNVMDPIGFAMESFDAVGAWREKDEAGLPIDASGRLASGAAIDGPASLRDALTADPEHFARAFTEKLLTYAIGRGLEYYDMPTVRQIVRDSAREDLKFSAIVRGIVRSPQFRMRTATGEANSLTAALPSAGG